jgi:hypothetical protein
LGGVFHESAIKYYYLSAGKNLKSILEILKKIRHWRAMASGDGGWQKTAKFSHFSR